MNAFRMRVLTVRHTQGVPSDLMTVTTTYETTRWLSNDMFAVTGQRGCRDGRAA